MQLKFSLMALSIFLVDITLAQASKEYSPYLDEDRPRQVFWGDTHLHSDLSTDAMGFGVSLANSQFKQLSAIETSRGNVASIDIR